MKHFKLLPPLILFGLMLSGVANAQFAPSGPFLPQALRPVDSPTFGGLTLNGNVGIGASSTVDGRDISVDGTKLDGVESFATADQSNAEIKTAYEANANTNEFSDAEQTKLSGVSTGAIANVAEDLTPQLGGSLDVNGNNITSSTGLDISIGASAGNDFTIDTNKLVVEGDTGFVGLNTAVPTVLLDVPSHSATDNSVEFGTFGFQSLSTNSAFIQTNLYWSGSDLIYRNTGFGAMLQFSNGDFFVRSAPSGTAGSVATLTTNLYVAQNGLVGIGTSSPIKTLDVFATGTAIMRVKSDLNPNIRAEDSTNNVFVKMQATDSSANMGTESNHSFNIRTNNTVRATFDVAGNVGIGEIAPATLLQLTGASTPTLYIKSTTASNGGRFMLEDTDGAGCTSITALNGVLTAAVVTCE